MRGEKLDENYAIARLKKVKRIGLRKCHAARAENGLELEHLIPGNPAPQVMFNVAPAGVTFVNFVLKAYQDAVAKGLVYRPRKDQVLAVEGLVTASPGFFRPDNPGAAGEYIEEQVAKIRERVMPFLLKIFGPNLIRVEEQLDEVTPHWQFALLPFDNRGRWSAKNLMSRTFLVQLWDKWHEATEDLGLKRGLPGMIASHSAVRKFYGAAEKFERMQAAANQKIRVEPIVIETPSRAALFNPKKISEDINRQIEDWAENQTQRINKKLQPLFAAVAGQLLQKRRAAEHRQSAIKLATENRSTKTKLTKLEATLSRLTPVSPKNVAVRLGLPGIPKHLQNEDAISLFAKLEGLNESEAIGWLVNEFGAHAAASIAADRTRAEFLRNADSFPCPKVLPNPDIAALIDSQFDALRADSYEVLLIPQNGGPTTLTRYAGIGKAPRHWSGRELIAEIPRLKLANANARVLLLPTSSDYAYVHVEGKSAVDALRNQGIDACLGLKLSAETEQAVIRLPIDEHHKKRVQKIAQICRELGFALKLADARAAIFLAGFRLREGSDMPNQRPAASHIVDISHALDYTCRAGIEWTRAPRPGFEPDR